MHKFSFSIKTRSGQFVERIVIAGKDQEDAERKLKQMYRYCDVVACVQVRQTARSNRNNLPIDDLFTAQTH